MDDNSGDDDTGEVRWSWRRDESGRGRSRRGWRSEWGSWFQGLEFRDWNLCRPININVSAVVIKSFAIVGQITVRFVWNTLYLLFKPVPRLFWTQMGCPPREIHSNSSYTICVQSLMLVSRSAWYDQNFKLICPTTRYCGYVNHVRCTADDISTCYKFVAIFACQKCESRLLLDRVIAIIKGVFSITL